MKLTNEILEDLPGKVIVFNENIEKNESDFDSGMKVRVIRVEFHPEYYKIWMSFAEFEEENKKFMKATYWPIFSTNPEIKQLGHDKEHLIKWIETSLYPKSKTTEEYFDYNEDCFEIV